MRSQKSELGPRWDLGYFFDLLNSVEPTGDLRTRNLWSKISFIEDWESAGLPLPLDSDRWIDPHH